jgi:PAS domain S-box-containing protein
VPQIQNQRGYFAFYGPSWTQVAGIFERKAMPDHTKMTEAQLLEEVSALRQQVQELEAAATVQKDMAAALRESEERFELFMDHLPGIAFIKDEDSRPVYMNKYFREILGASDAWVGQLTTDIFSGEMGERMVADDREAFRRGYKVREERVVGEDGEERVYHTQKFVFATSSGAPLLGGLSMDITERKMAEEALGESESRFRLLSESSPMGVFHTDQEGAVLYTNTEWQKITEMTMSDSLGFGWAEALHPDDKEHILQEWEICLREQRGFNGDFRFIRPSGDVRWVHTHTSPIRTDAGKIIGHVGVNEDITDRKETEIALQRSEEKYRKLTDTLPQIVYEMDVEGVLTFVNQRALDVFQYTEEEFAQGLTALEMLVPEDRERAQQTIAMTMAGKTTKGTEYTAQRKDGSTLPIIIYSAPIMEGEKPVGLRGIILDLTEQKQLEDQLRLAQKAEAIGRLAGGVAHDFNNLLQVILGYGQMALNDLEKGSKAHDRVGEVMNAGHRATTLVSQLLAFSRRQLLKLENLDLNIVVHDIAKMVRRVIGEDVTFVVYSNPALNIIRADRGQIEQVLMNLCVNARDAMPDGGQIAIQTANTALTAEFCTTHPWAKPGEYVELKVSDTGFGMSEEILAQIFDPFFTTKETGKGTGLGLAMVYGIVQQHHGIVNVESKATVGTTFTLYFPVTQEPTLQPEEKEKKVPRGGTETILMAEDDSGVRRLAQTLLEGVGYKLIVARDGEEAVHLYNERHKEIELVLLDVVMPKLGGRKVFEHIRTMAPDLPILFSSGYTSDFGHTNFIMDEGLRLISKPYDNDALLQAVRDELDGPRESTWRKSM